MLNQPLSKTYTQRGSVSMDRTAKQAALRAENMELSAKVKKSVLSKFMYSQGYQSIPYYEYYRDIFPGGELATWNDNPKEQTETDWLYNGVLLMDTGKTKKIDSQDCFGNYIQVTKKTKTRLMLFDDLMAIDVAVNKALKNGQHSLLSPISYCGRSRAIESERFLYAVIIEIDGLITKKVDGKRDKEQSGMKNILHQIKSNLYLSPSYIVCSGNGVHLVWLLNEPMPLFAFPFAPKINFKTEKKGKRKSKGLQIPEDKPIRGNGYTIHWDYFRQHITSWIWNDAVSDAAVQYEYHGQGFRTVGSLGKQGHLVEVFKICDRRYSMTELFTQPGTFCKRELAPFGLDVLKDQVAPVTKSKLVNDGLLKKIENEGQTLSPNMLEAKAKWPEWYERRVVRKEPPRQKGEWNVSRNVYSWYKNLIVQGASVGCRYWRLYTLAQYARKCHVPFDELHTDGLQIGELFKAIDDGASLSDYEIEKALAEGYLEKLSPKTAIDFVNEKAQLEIKKNRRNGLSKAENLEVARHLQSIQDKKNNTNWRDGNGRKSKLNIVAAWRVANPEGRKVDCIRETGLGKTTVNKWWNAAC